jgi:3-hydroxyacyl-CoA dehydrogenase
MNVQTIGVVGAGTMGNGIAHVCAKAGFKVTLVEVEQRFLDRGLAAIVRNLARPRWCAGTHSGNAVARRSGRVSTCD